MGSWVVPAWESGTRFPRPSLAPPPPWQSIFLAWVPHPPCLDPFPQVPNDA